MLLQIIHLNAQVMIALLHGRMSNKHLFPETASWLQILNAVWANTILPLSLFACNLQKKYWDELKAQQKIAIMDILLSSLEFAASYNASTKLRTRMHRVPGER